MVVDALVEAVERGGAQRGRQFDAGHAEPGGIRGDVERRGHRAIVAAGGQSLSRRTRRRRVDSAACRPTPSAASPVRDAVVIGGGIAGLSAAWDLRNRDIVVLEGAERLGGRIRSEARDPYWLNLGAHVFSGPGSATGRLVADVGVESRARAGPPRRARAQRAAARRWPARAVPAAPAAATGRARRARARGRATAPRGRPLRARGQAASRRVAGRDAQAAARARRRPHVLRLARRAAGRRRPDVPRDRDALHGRAGGDHRGRGHRLLRARLELGLGPLPQHRRRRRSVDRRHRSRAARARSSRTPTVQEVAEEGERRARALPQRRASSASCARGMRSSPPRPSTRRA